MSKAKEVSEGTRLIQQRWKAGHPDCVIALRAVRAERAETLKEVIELIENPHKHNIKETFIKDYAGGSDAYLNEIDLIDKIKKLNESDSN